MPSPSPSPPLPSPPLLCPPSTDSPSCSGSLRSPRPPSLRVPSRSPHPYHRRRAELTTTSLTPPESGPRKSAQSPSESGTEADDEGYGYGFGLGVKALPAPPFKPRKGLRSSEAAEAAETPLLTPTKLDDDVGSFGVEYFAGVGVEGTGPKGEESAVLRKVQKRRQREFLRRGTEVGLLVLLGTLVLGNGCGWVVLAGAEKGAIISLLLSVAACGLLYPIRLVAYSWKRTKPRKQMQQCVRVPTSFDPAPAIYPPLIPLFVALSSGRASSETLLANIVLGISAIPSRLIPLRPAYGYSIVHWVLSLIPIFICESLDPSFWKTHRLGLHSDRGDREIHGCLFILHHSLLPFLHYLTTTSLLSTERQLLSIALINLLLFSTSPPAVILTTIVWVGGLGLYIFCAPTVRWGIALARIPRWRLRRAGRIIQARQSFITLLNERLKQKMTQHSRLQAVESDADEDENLQVEQEPKLVLDTLKTEVLNALKDYLPTDMAEPRSAIERSGRGPFNSDDPETVKQNREKRQCKRRNTLPARTTRQNGTIPVPSPRRKRPNTSTASFFLSLTPEQALLRKWAYAGILYTVMLALILGPIRLLISKYALQGHEPIGWAIGYMLGEIPSLRLWIVTHRLDQWIPLPPLPEHDHFPSLSWRTLSSLTLISNPTSPATNRLLLCLYCFLILTLGMLTNCTLTPLVEVDTRRKVFHGTMVFILLPTVFVDPPFLALALALILALFLILDLLRASQLPPLSSPLARFLAPYVDGRDLRGPVVVSHIFLLIGCAVPLWLSVGAAYASSPPHAHAPFTRQSAPPVAHFDPSTDAVAVAAAPHHPYPPWTLPRTSRDMGMLAGVISVGLGDAAASLVGRRIGRHKWPWSGGKSLEGSAAFAAAAVVGLVVGKAWGGWGGWLGNGCGGWFQGGEGCEVGWKWNWGLGAVVAAVGASVTEAVLTGGNDNVLVPVVLWVWVRGLGL